MTTMTTDQIRAAVLRVLGSIAPEADLAALAPDVSLREQLDIDSMDALNFMIGLDAACGVDVPERDYGRLVTLDDCVAYVAAARGA
jgi:acyl carrier protein